MTPFYLFESFYAFIAFWFGYYTFAEGSNARSGWDKARLAGLFACVFWPLLIVAVLIPRFADWQRAS